MKSEKFVAQTVFYDRIMAGSVYADVNDPTFRFTERTERQGEWTVAE